VVRTIPAKGSPEASHIAREVLFSVNGDRLFCTSGRIASGIGVVSLSLELWDTRTGKLLRRFNLGKTTKQISWICFTADGRGFATGEHRKV
jgi:hypothetical protein